MQQKQPGEPWGATRETVMKRATVAVAFEIAKALLDPTSETRGDDPGDRISGSGAARHIPTWEDQHGGVALQRTRQNLRALYTETHAVVLDGGEGSLGDTSVLRQLILTQALQLADNTDRLADRNIHSLLCGTKQLHLKVSGSRVR